MRSVGLFFALAVAPYHALAQPVEHPDIEPASTPAAALELAILVDATADLDSAAVRSAIAADLGVQVSDAPGTALGSLAISIVAQSVRIEYRPVNGPSVERTVALPATRDDRARLIAFIATNLVRDQASEILAGLPATPPPAPEQEPTPAVVVPPIAQPTPAVTPAPRASHFPFSLGLVPPLAVDRVAGAKVVVGVGVHAVAGHSDGSQYASISGAVDTKTQFASGAQIAGALAVAGRIDDGVQIAGAAALSRGNTEGGQIAGAAAITRGDLAGIQIAGAAAMTVGNAYGIQIGGAASGSKRDLTGIQLGGGATFAAGTATGLQIAGGASIANRLRGLQIAGGANIAGDATGMQIGTINIAKRMRGVQLGVVNITEDSDGTVPIGVINYSKNGPLAVDAWLDTAKISAVAFRHGTKHVHNLWSIGWSPDHEHMMVGAGIGIHRAINTGASQLGFDLDAMYWMTDVTGGDPDKSLSQLRASIAVPIGPLDLFGGVAANVHVVTDEDMMASEDFHPIAERRVTSDGGTTVTTWPTVFAGARMRLR
ncbi:MAG: hypothetical protein SFX73_27550 [Kofleriaceae bacterium]|nr:hypothetical protein [Kofleriaceae bacterium]